MSGTVDIATLAIEIDSTKARLAALELENFRKKGQEAEQQTKTLVGAWDKFSASALSLKSAFQALAAAAPLIMLKDMIQSVIETRTHLANLAAQAGVTAEALGRFAVPAAKAGQSIDDVGHAMFMLSKAMEAARDPQSRQAQAFTALGISLGQIKSLKPDEMFQLVAQQLQKFTDGAQKNAVMQELMSRSGYQMAAVMKEVASSTNLVSRITNEQAEEAKRLEAQWIATKKSLDQAKAQLVNEMMPTLKAASGAVEEAAKSGGLLLASWVALGAVWPALFQAIKDLVTSKPDDKIAGMQHEILDLQVKIREQQALHLANAEEIIKRYNTRIELLQAEIRFQKELDIAQRGGYDDQASRTARQHTGAVTPTKSAVPFDPEAVRILTEALKAFHEAIAKGSGLEGDYLEKLKQFQIVLASGKVPMDQYRAAVEAYIKQQPFFTEQEKGMKAAAESATKAFEAQVKVINELRNVTDNFGRSMKDSTDQLAFENSLIGKSALEVQQLTEARRIDLDLRNAILALPVLDEDASAEQLQRYTDAVTRLRSAADAAKGANAALIGQGAMLREQVDLFTKLGDVAGDFFNSLMQGGKQAVDYLRNLFRSLLVDLIKLFAQKLILQFGASFLGVSGGGAALASAAGSAGTGTLAGSLLTSGMNFAGGAATSLIGGTIGTGLGASFANLGLLMSGQAAAIGGIGSGIMAALPALGAIGIAIIGIAALAGAFSSRGGPKGGGSSALSFDASGNSTPWSSVNNGAGRLYTPNNDDSTVGRSVTQLGQSYYQIVRQLGGTARAVNFALGYDTDPNGTAQNRTSAVATLGGRTIYSNINQNIGRDNSQIGPALQLETSRMLLSALQQSDLPKQVAALLNSVIASTASQDEINKILAAAADLKNVLDMLGQIHIAGLDVDSLKGIQKEGETLTGTLQRVVAVFQATSLIADQAFGAVGVATMDAREQLTDFAGGVQAFAQASQFYYEHFYTASEQVARSTNSLRESFTSLGLTMPSTREGFRNLMESFDLTTESGRRLYAQVLQLAPAFDSVVTATAQAVSRFNQIASHLSPTFGAGNARSVLESMVGQWRQFGGNITEGDKGGLRIVGQYGPVSRTVEQTIGDIGSLIRNNQIGSALTYAQGLGGNAVTVLNDMLQAYSDWQDAMNTATPNIQNFGSTVDNAAQLVADAAMQEAAARKQVTDSMKDWLTKTMTGPLSPLVNDQKLALLANQFQQTIALAKGGDLIAMGQVTNAADAYLKIAQEVYGSGFDYSRIFRDVTNQVAGIAGVNAPTMDNMLAKALPESGKLASSVDIRNLCDTVEGVHGAIDRLLDVVSNGINVSDSANTAAVTKLSRAGGMLSPA